MTIQPSLPAPQTPCRKTKSSGSHESWVPLHAKNKVFKCYGQN